MDPTPPRRLLHRMLLGLLALACCGWAQADPPSRVARLAFSSGLTSFSPGGETDWARATVNRPLVSGDRLWSDAASRAELQLGGAEIRLGAFTSITLLNVDDRTAQVRLAQGSLNLRIWRLDRDRSFEVDTPNLAFSIRRPGNYRVDVNADGESTVVSVRAGEAEVSAEGSAFVVGPGRSFRFRGTGLRDYASVTIGRPDDFDRWASARDRRWQDSVSARYVARDLIGYQDLDSYGSWRPVAGYGNVWTPRRVAADWAPYRDGHWAWIEPWGWTWVDAAPWGFASSHYGRWARLESAWCWVPGPVAAVPVYAPALVAFIGAGNFGRPGAAQVGWFPLGPTDVYRPSYVASRDYFTRVNTSNTVINVTNITNVYNNINVSRVTYVNQQVPGAVIAVPATTFVQARPVGREAMRVTRDMVEAAGVVATVPLAPVRASLLGAGMAASVRPPEPVEGRRVLSRLAPPPVATSFAMRQGVLAANAAPLAAAAPLMQAATPIARQNVVPPVMPVLPVAPVASRPTAQPRVVPSTERESRQERRVERVSAAPNAAARSPAAGGVPPAPPVVVASTVRSAAPAPVRPVPPRHAQPEAFRPVPLMQPQARLAPSAEPAHRNGAHRAADEERRVAAPPATTRPPEPPRPTLALPPPAARQGPHALAAPVAAATPPAPTAAAAQRHGHGEAGGREKKGEARRGGEETPERRR